MMRFSSAQDWLAQQLQSLWFGTKLGHKDAKQLLHFQSSFLYHHCAMPKAFNFFVFVYSPPSSSMLFKTDIFANLFSIWDEHRLCLTPARPDCESIRDLHRKSVKGTGELKCSSNNGRRRWWNGGGGGEWEEQEEKKQNKKITRNGYRLNIIIIMLS